MAAMRPDIETLKALRAGYARLALVNVEAIAVFERIDADCMDAEILAANDPVAILRSQIEKRKEAA